MDENLRFTVIWATNHLGDSQLGDTLYSYITPPALSPISNQSCVAQLTQKCRPVGCRPVGLRPVDCRPDRLSPK